MSHGYVDLQVNGFAGIDFTSRVLSARGIDQVGRDLFDRGTTAYCPTVITSSMATYTHCLPLLAAHRGTPSVATNLGIHLEGPFLNPTDGTRGVHPREFIQPPSIEVFERLRDLAEDRIVILTLAPEIDGAIELIEHVVQNTGTIVSIGHSAATPAEIRLAIDAGATLATHVGNGIADQIHRHENTLWPILSDDRITAMLITDGYHLPDEFIRVALKAKGANRIIITSDVVHLAGCNPGKYDFHGVEVVLEENGRLHREGAYQLSGSSCTMLECMNHLASLDVLVESEFSDVGANNALRLLGANTA